MIVARRSADKFARVLGEEFDNRLGVFFFKRFAGDDNCPGVNVFRCQSRLFVGLVNKLIDLVGIDFRRRQSKASA